MGYQHRQHPCFPTSCHLQRRHQRQQTANRFKWSRCWEVAVLTMLVTHTRLLSKCLRSTTHSCEEYCPVIDCCYEKEMFPTSLRYYAVRENSPDFPLAFVLHFWQ